MRCLLSLLFLTGAALQTGCSSVLSLCPIDEMEEPDPGLAGVWMDQGDDDPVIVRTGGGGALDIRYGELRLSGRTFRVESATYLDVTPQKDMPFYVPGHSVIRYWLEGDVVRWAFVDSKWLQARIVESGLPMVKVRDFIVLTGKAELVRDLLGKDGQDRRACGEVNELKRIR